MDDDTLRNLQAQACQKRKHAPFFSWHDKTAVGKGLVEAGVLDELLNAMRAQGDRAYRSLGPSGEQWPDIWLQDSNGQRIPCEVTELVEERAMPAGDSRQWTDHELADRLQAIIAHKGMRSLGAGGTRSILVVYTDEFYLNADSVAAALATVRFTCPVSMQRVLLLLSYDPNRNGYRYFELQLAAS